MELYPQKLSLILPLYNEQQRFIEAFSICRKLGNQFKGWELIFVDDGSTDNTKSIVTKVIKPFSGMRLVSYSQNRGKGYAIRKGITAAKNDLILFSDIDFSTPITELELLFPFITRGADIVIGTRKVKGAQINKHQPKFREWMGKQFTKLTNLWLGLDISDYTCGFKLFKKKVAKKIFKVQKVERWGFDAEVLFLANLFDYKIAEVPIVWENDERSKVSLSRDVIRSLHDLWLIRWNYFLGKYS